MTCGLVHTSYSLPEWQAVKLAFSVCSLCVIPTSKVYSWIMLAFAVVDFCHNKFEASFRKHVLSNQSSWQSLFVRVFYRMSDLSLRYVRGNLFLYECITE